MDGVADEGVQVGGGEEALVGELVADLGGEGGGGVLAHPGAEAVADGVVRQGVGAGEVGAEGSFSGAGGAWGFVRAGRGGVGVGGGNVPRTKMMAKLRGVGGRSSMVVGGCEVDGIWTGLMVSAGVVPAEMKVGQ